MSERFDVVVVGSGAGGGCALGGSNGAANAARATSATNANVTNRTTSLSYNDQQPPSGVVFGSSAAQLAA